MLHQTYTASKVAVSPQHLQHQSVMSPLEAVKSGNSNLLVKKNIQLSNADSPKSVMNVVQDLLNDDISGSVNVMNSEKLEEMTRSNFRWMLNKQQQQQQFDNSLPLTIRVAEHQNEKYTATSDDKDNQTNSKNMNTVANSSPKAEIYFHMESHPSESLSSDRQYKDNAAEVVSDEDGYKIGNHCESDKGIDNHSPISVIASDDHLNRQEENGVLDLSPRENGNT